MKAQELRLGNTISRMHDINDSVIEIVDMFTIDWINRNPNNETYQPIPLTEDWLLKFGFEKSETGFYTKGRFTYHPEYSWKILENWIKDWVGVTPIIYVHQLQNLYYALTGTELCTT